MDIEQLRKDMEAGTQGEWVANINGEDDFSGVPIHSQSRGFNFAPIAYCPVDFTDRDVRLTDARRIARLPELEAAYLDLKEKADALAEAAQHVLNSSTDANLFLLEKSLAEYRKATT